MTHADQQAHHPLKDHQIPGRDYLEGKLKATDIGWAKAESLKDVVSHDDQEREIW